MSEKKKNRTGTWSTPREYDGSTFVGKVLAALYDSLHTTGQGWASAYDVADAYESLFDDVLNPKYVSGSLSDLRTDRTVFRHASFASAPDAKFRVADAGPSTRWTLRVNDGVPVGIDVGIAVPVPTPPTPASGPDVRWVDDVTLADGGRVLVADGVAYRAVAL